MDLQALLGLSASPATPLSSIQGKPQQQQTQQQQEHRNGDTLTPGRRRLFDAAPSSGGSSPSSGGGSGGAKQQLKAREPFRSLDDIGNRPPLTPSPVAAKMPASAGAQQRRGGSAAARGVVARLVSPSLTTSKKKAKKQQQLQLVVEEEDLVSDEDGENRTPNVVQPALSHVGGSGSSSSKGLGKAKATEIPVRGGTVGAAAAASAPEAASPAPSVATLFYLSSDSDSEEDEAGEEALLAAGVVGGGEKGAKAAVFFFPEDEEELMAAARRIGREEREKEEEVEEQQQQESVGQGRDEKAGAENGVHAQSPPSPPVTSQHRQQPQPSPAHTPQPSRHNGPLPRNPPPTPASPLLVPLTPDSAMAAPHSVDRLLRRARAVQTPEMAGPAKVQSWISERVLSAVKRFVFEGTSGTEGEAAAEEEDRAVADTSSQAVLEEDGESIVEDCGPEHWPALNGESPAARGAAALLDVSELVSPGLLQQQQDQEEEEEEEEEGSASGWNGSRRRAVVASPALPSTMRPRATSTLGSPSPCVLAPPQTLPVSFSPSSPSRHRDPLPLQQGGRLSSTIPPPPPLPSSSAPAAPLFSPPPRSFAHTRKPVPCPPPAQPRGRPKHAWGAGGACSVHMSELREDDIAPNAAEEEAQLLQRLRAVAGAAWGKGEGAAASSSPLAPWTAERTSTLQQEPKGQQQQQRGGGSRRLLRVLAAAAAAPDRDVTFSSEASYYSSQEEGAASSDTPAPAEPAAAAAATAAAAVPPPLNLPNLYSPPLKAPRTHLRPPTKAAASLSASMPAPFSASASSATVGGSSSGRLGQRKGLSRSMGALPSVSRRAAGAATAAAAAPATSYDHEHEKAEEDQCFSAASPLSAAPAAGAAPTAAAPSFACTAPVTWTGVRVGSSASRELHLRNLACLPAGGGCPLTATVTPSDAPFAVEGTVEGAGEARVVVTFRPLAPGVHHAVLCLALSGRLYKVQLAGSAQFAGNGRRQQQQQWQQQQPCGGADDEDSLALSGAFLSASSGPTRPLTAARRDAVFFASPVLDFGRRRAGSVVIEKIQLSNPSQAPQTLVVQPVDLPFVLLHRRIALKPRAFVRLPVRFVPVGPGPFRVMLQAVVYQEEEQLWDGMSAAAAAAPYRVMLELRGEGVE